MNQSTGTSEQTWGVRVNTKRWGNPEDCPAWASSTQREKWRQQGLLLWDHRSRQITTLSATQALELLKHLRTAEDWRELGLTIGQPATALFPYQPDRKPEASLIDTRVLSPDHLREILDLLQRRESQLQEMSELEEQERTRRLAKVYRIILNYPKAREEGQPDVTDPKP